MGRIQRIWSIVAAQPRRPRPLLSVDDFKPGQIPDGPRGPTGATGGAQVGNQVVRNQSMAGADGYTAHFDNALANGNDAQIFVDASCANANQVVLKPPAAKP